MTVRKSALRNMGTFEKPAEPLFRVLNDSALNLLGVQIEIVHCFAEVAVGFEYGSAPVIEGLNACLNVHKSV